MCDTVGKIGRGKRLSIFAKNSDRQYHEPQVMVFIDKKKHTEKMVKTTYIEVEQVKETHAILISKPTWIWGAEMGVNDCGVCIGNEAIETNTAAKQPKALIGMDYVRLALERSNSAKEAVDVIIELLLKYGQGGNCGYQTEFFYDNSYLIMDRTDLYILETVGKNYAVKKKDKASISNCLSITKSDYGNANRNFKKQFTDRVDKDCLCRKKMLDKKLVFAKNVEDYFAILRTHSKKKGYDSICMHGDYETTNSMVVVLAKEPIIYFTGCPNPCVAEFKEYTFGEEMVYPIVEEANQDNCEFWKEKRYGTKS